MADGRKSKEVVMKGYNTKAVQTRLLKKDPHGSLHMPVYDNAAFEFDSAEDMELAFAGKKPAHMYSRITNPTVEHFEQKVQNLTGALGVVAVSSGMAAIANLIIAVAQSGDTIITTKHLFGNTLSLFETTLKPWGLKVAYVDLAKPESLEASIDKTTKIVFFETVTNPQLEVVDIKAISTIAKKHNILVAVDSTITPLYLSNLKKLGVDVEVVSSTKYISGGATSIGGVIIDYGTFDWSKNEKLQAEAKKFGSFTLINKLRRESNRNLGACLSPHNAYLQSVGLETFGFRAEKSGKNTLELANYLREQKKVKGVNYPGLADSTAHTLARKQFNGFFGAVLTFDLNSKKECFAFMDNLHIIRRATNLNDNRTLILHPSSTIFHEFEPEAKANMGVRDSLLRLAVGIEDVDDLKEDIAQALEAL